MFEYKETAPFIELELEEEIEGMLSGNGEPNFDTYEGDVPVTNVPDGEWNITAINSIYTPLKRRGKVTLTVATKQYVNDYGLFLPIK